MKAMNRRDFVTSSLAVGAATLLPSNKGYAANEKVVLGVMGLGGRGTYLADQFVQRKDVEIAYLCDPNTRRFARAREAVEENQSRRPKLIQDFRKMLDDPQVDAIINATPDHWHALGSIMACQAGKDVYVEKPMTHSLWEGRKMIEAAQKYKRIVQVGMQSRSAEYINKAKEYIQSGKLGKVHLVKVFNMLKHPFRKKGPDQPVPEGFDYEMWCGPGPKLPYNPQRNWLNRWEYSCGPIAGDAVHQIDMARYLINDIPFPRTVSHTGAIYALQDGRNTPDTQMALFEYDNLTLAFEATLWTSYMKKIPVNIRESDKFPNWPFCSTRVEVYGTEGFMYFGRHGGGWQAYDGNGELVQSGCGRGGDNRHEANFIECIRSRKKPNADAEVGHHSVLLCHLANISYRAGNKRLEFDGQTEQIKNLSEANQYLKRTYRKPWIIPENV